MILNKRDRQPELMDQPDLETARHQRALRGLARINWWSRSAESLWPAIRQAASAAETRLRVLDVATGAGDVPIRLWSKARKAGLDLEIKGCDLSETALEYARSRAENFGAQIEFFRIDALNEQLPDYDIITSSLFLHHLEEEHVVQLLRKAGDSARQMLLINDLRRSFLGWLFAWIGTRILSRSPVVHRDGPVSVRAAFTTGEMLGLAEKAGLRGATIRRTWPFRFLLTWRKCGKKRDGK